MVKTSLIHHVEVKGNLIARDQDLSEFQSDVVIWHHRIAVVFSAEVFNGKR